jgi:hypothetical protein
MVRARAPLFLAAAFLAGALPLACGGSSAAPSGHDDAGAHPAPGASTSAAPPLDAGPDTTPAEAGTSLVPVASGATLVGWTTDERLVYQTIAGVFALDRSGETDTVLSTPWPDAGTASIGTSGVFLARGAELGIWTKASGYHVLTSSALGPIFEQSQDGTRALHFETSAEGGAGTAIVVQDVDGTEAQALATASADEVVHFTAAEGIVFEDEVATDGGSAPGFELFAGGLLTPLVRAAGTWSTGPGVATIFNVDPDGVASLVRTSDGQATPVDTSVRAGALFDATGANVYYVGGATGSALKKVEVSSGTTSTLLTSGADAPVALSPDGTLIEISLGTSYALVSTAGSAPIDVGAAGIESAGGFFTMDSRYVVSITAEDAQGTSWAAVPVTGGASAASWTAIDYALPLVDSRVLLADQSGNLLIADAAGKVPTRPIATAIAHFAVSPDRQQIAYQTGNAVYVVATQ